MFNKKNDLNISDARTVIGPSVKVKGTIKAEDNITIEGIFEGNVNLRGDLYVAEGAEILGNVQANRAVIAGAVNGNISADDAVEITEAGKVLGDVTATVLKIAPGAIFSGKSQMKEVEAEAVKKIIPELEEIQN